MISRRNIRVKVMQTLYSVDSFNGDTRPGEPESILSKKIEQSRQLFTYLVYFLTEVARYAEKDADKRAHKHLPSAADLSVNTKIAGNNIVWKILEDKSFIEATDEMKLHNIVDEELLKKIYHNLVETDEYKEYIEEKSRDKKDEKRIIEIIFNTLMLPNEAFTTHVEEHFLNWDDDAEMMQTLVLNYLNRMPENAFSDIVDNDKRIFAKDLLLTVLGKSDFLMEMIKPKLKNWDADRIASLDMVLLQMGISEFLYFDTIPTKVTINEYIDLAKEYSTPQSGQFVNGILDNIHKELVAENKIEKRSFK